MPGVEIVHRYEVEAVEVVDHRTIRADVRLGFGVGTTVECRVKGVKAIRSEEKAAEAAEVLTQALNGDVVIETTRSSDQYEAAVFVNGKPLKI